MARELCEKMLSYTSPLYLYAEEIDPRSGRHLGNFPQAFTHLALINAVMHVIRADHELMLAQQPLDARRRETGLLRAPGDEQTAADPEVTLAVAGGDTARSRRFLGPPGRRVRVTTVADPAAAAERCAETLGMVLRGALGERGEAHIALNGGTTPRPVYERLVELIDDWSHVHLWWCDERCVPADHEDSNFPVPRETLIEGAGIGEERVHRMRGELGPEEGARAYAAELAEHLELDDAGIPVLDVVHLGLGPDGHTASLFPDHPALEVTDVGDRRHLRRAQAAAGAHFAVDRGAERGATARAAHGRRGQARRGRPPARRPVAGHAGFVAETLGTGGDRR